MDLGRLSDRLKMEIMLRYFFVYLQGVGLDFCLDTLLALELGLS